MPAPLVALAGRPGAASRVSRDAVCFAGRRYLDAVLRAGGEPVVLAPNRLDEAAAREVMARFDALILMGGGDVDPQRYGQQPGPHVYGVSPEQDAFESALLLAALDLRRPVLAICRGMQLANVVLGGTLVQDLGELPNAAELLAHKPSQFPMGAEFVLHPVDVESGSMLADALGVTTLQGASFHHQGMGGLAESLAPVAWAPDGLVEAVESRDPDRWLVGVQWHPEDTAASDPVQQRLYDSFVSRCA